MHLRKAKFLRRAKPPLPEIPTEVAKVPQCLKGSLATCPVAPGARLAAVGRADLQRPMISAIQLANQPHPSIGAPYAALVD
jgi:hypothetical protein